MTVIAIEVSVLETVPRDLLKGLEVLEIGRRTKIIQITTLLRSARILRKAFGT